MTELHPTAQRVQAALVAAGSNGQVMTMAARTKTAAEAADALGVELGQIANSLVFDVDGRAVLVMSSGANRVDLDRLGDAGRRCGQACDPELVRRRPASPSAGSRAVGLPAPLPTFVDRDLASYDEVWTAGGTPDTLFATTADELVRLTGGTLADTALAARPPTRASPRSGAPTPPRP